MNEHQHQTAEPAATATETRRRSTGSPRRAWTEWTEWSSDRAVDPGDSHDKGEQSLCVGEAA